MITLSNRKIGKGEPTFIIAELSGNHKGDINRAKEIIKAAKDANVDAIKLQTYTADTITLNCDKPDFQTLQGSLWDGRTLYNLYEEAYTPWEWHKELMDYANSLGLICFSSPFDLTAVDFLETLNVPAYKIASFEINDIRLIEYAASKGKPMIMSTGVATIGEIEDAVEACLRMNNDQIILLKCCSAYPTPLEEVNLKTIPNMKETFNVEVGLSDHTLGYTVALGAVALGACVVEKHITLDRTDGSVDSAFSMEPQEFKEMVYSTRDLEKALGCVTYKLTEKQQESTVHKRSLYIAKELKKGDIITSEHIKSVRPAYGLNTKYYSNLVGKVAKRDAEFGTPTSWDLI